MKFKGFVISFILIGLFAFSFVSFASVAQQEQGIEDNIINDSNVGLIYSGLNDSFENEEGMYSDANDSVGAINQGEEVSGSGGELFFNAVRFVGSSLGGIAETVFNSIFDPLLKGLGMPEGVRKVVGAVLGTIFLITIALLAWRLFKRGE